MFKSHPKMEARKTLIEVHMPPLYRASFEDLKREIAERANAVQKGLGNDTVILFAENSLKYGFDFPLTEAQLQAQCIKEMLPQHPWIAVMYNAMVEDEGKPMNMGFLVTSDYGVKGQAKRGFSQNDWGEYHARNRRDSFKDVSKSWEKSFGTMASYGIPYLRAISRSGASLEYRICCDVENAPIKNEPDAVTFVSSCGLELRQLSGIWGGVLGIRGGILSKRAGVVVHDEDTMGLRGLYVKRYKEKKTAYWEMETGHDIPFVWRYAVPICAGMGER
jgi:hypothetical protein